MQGSGGQGSPGITGGTSPSTGPTSGDPGSSGPTTTGEPTDLGAFGGFVPIDKTVVPTPVTTSTTLADQLAAELAALQALQDQSTGTPRYAAVPATQQSSNALLYIILLGGAVGAYFIFRKKKVSD